MTDKSRQTASTIEEWGDPEITIRGARSRFRSTLRRRLFFGLVMTALLSAMLTVVPRGHRTQLIGGSWNGAYSADVTTRYVLAHRTEILWRDDDGKTYSLGEHPLPNTSPPEAFRLQKLSEKICGFHVHWLVLVRTCLAIYALIVCVLIWKPLRAYRNERSRINEHLCPNCGYPQFGLSSLRCPECGHPVSLAERAKRGSAAKLKEILQRAPDLEPDPSDRITP